MIPDDKAIQAAITADISASVDGLDSEQRIRAVVAAWLGEMEVQGFRVVPVEPTDEMYDAANDIFTPGHEYDRTMRDCYTAMLAVAPQAEG